MSPAYIYFYKNVKINSHRRCWKETIRALCTCIRTSVKIITPDKHTKSLPKTCYRRLLFRSTQRFAIIAVYRQVYASYTWDNPVISGRTSRVNRVESYCPAELQRRDIIIMSRVIRTRITVAASDLHDGGSVKTHCSRP